MYSVSHIVLLKKFMSVVDGLVRVLVTVSFSVGSVVVHAVVAVAVLALIVPLSVTTQHITIQSVLERTPGDTMCKNACCWRDFKS